MRSPQALQALKKRVKTLEKVFFEYAKTTTEEDIKKNSLFANQFDILTKYLIELKENQDILFKMIGLLVELEQQKNIKRNYEIQINQNEKIKNFA